MLAPRALVPLLVAAAGVGAATVTITEYADAQCPCSAQFAADVGALLDSAEFGPHLDFSQRFVPACMDAAAHCGAAPSPAQLQTCIHGAEECVGHRFFICAQNQSSAGAPAGGWPTYRSDPRWLAFQRCSDGACSQCDVFHSLLCLTPCTNYSTFPEWQTNDVMRTCALRVGLDWGRLQACAEGGSAEGDALQQRSSRDAIAAAAVYGTEGLPVVYVGGTRVTTKQLVPLYCGPTPCEVIGEVCTQLRAAGIRPAPCATADSLRAFVRSTVGSDC